MARPDSATSAPLPAPTAAAAEAKGSDDRHARLWLRRLASRRLTQSIAATTVYAVFAIYLTWPLVTDLHSTIYGAAGDLTGGISTFREYVQSGQFPFAPGTLHDFNAPDGLAVRWTLNISTLSSTAILYAFTEVFGAIAAFGLFTLLGLVLSGLAMFLLVRRLVGHAGVAFVAGYAYAFYPFVVVTAQGHVAFVHGWVLVVLLWRLIELMERPTRRNGAWVGAALLLAFTWSPYHILFAGVMALASAAVALVFAWRRRLVRPTLTAFSLAAAIGFVWLSGMVVLNRAAPANEVRTHTVQEAIAYSARWEEYVVPTSEHPIFGKAAGKYRVSHLHGSNFSENTLYVGITILALALIGFVSVVRRPGLPRRVAAVALAVSLAGFAFSAPPRVDLLGANLPTPTDVVFQLTTTWRAFSRLVEVVMLGLVLIAAMGIFAIVRRRALALQGVLLALILVVVAGDLWTARPTHGTNKIVVPETYRRLAAMPKGIAVEYPLVPADNSMYGDVFYQGWHDKPILNGYYAGSPEENRDLRLSNLSDPTTVPGLKALGVRYVLLRRDLKKAGLQSPGQPGRGLKLITEDPYIALYELVLPGPQVLVSPMEGFAPTETGTGGRFQWMTAKESTIELRGSCSRCSGTVRISVTSFARPRTVTISGPGGAVLARASAVERGTLRFPIRFSRKLVLHVEADPGPQSIAKTTGSLDTRSVSISVGGASFQFHGSRGP